ncbi:MAG: hypothetical protein GY830_00905 [Bacteroidetes bacterium]|nr:hypothetical protein [Bacteroidota bacterium]
MENKLTMSFYKNFIKMLILGILAFALSISNAFAKENKINNKESRKDLKKIVDVVSKDESGPEEETPKIDDQEPKGIISNDVYGGISSKVHFYNNVDGMDESRIETSLGAFIGVKSEYNIPDFAFPIKSNIKLQVTKKSYEDNEFKTAIKWAYFDVWKFRLGIAKSLFNPFNQSNPQIRFSWDFDSGWSLAFGIEASSNSNYFKKGSTEPSSETAKANYGKVLYLNDNGMAGDQTGDKWDYKLKRVDLLPVGAVLKFGYKIEDVVDTSLAVMGKPIIFNLQASKEKDPGEDEEGRNFGNKVALAGGMNFNTSINLFSKWAKLDLGLMFGNISSEISDWTGSFTKKQEQKRDLFYGLTDDGKLDTKDNIADLWALRASAGLTYHFTKSFSVNVVYFIDIAGPELSGKFFKNYDKEELKKDEPNLDEVGYKKAHQIKFLGTYDFNNEGKVKVILGPILNNPLESEPRDEKNMFEMFAMISVNFA